MTELEQAKADWEIIKNYNSINMPDLMDFVKKAVSQEINADPAIANCPYLSIMATTYDVIMYSTVVIYIIAPLNINYCRRVLIDVNAIFEGRPMLKWDVPTQSEIRHMAIQATRGPTKQEQFQEILNRLGPRDRDFLQNIIGNINES